MSDLPVIYSHSSATTQGTGTSIDILSANAPSYPPVMHCTVTGTSATVKVEGSHDNQAWIDYSGGGIAITPTAGFAKDLIPGVRFWRTNITAINGTVTSSVGPYPTVGGGWASPTNVGSTYTPNS